MRKQFINSLIELAEKDPDIYLLVGDLGFSFVEPFQEKFPKRYFNVGIAEQNLVGVATGLALAGKKPYIFTTINFAIFRPYEQLRTACYHNANVKIVGSSGGARFSFLGFTHNIEKDEDIKVLTGLPNIKIYTPIVADNVDKVIKESYLLNCPVYIRL